MYKLPYGESDFGKIRRKHYVYIDKTKYIELLEHDDSYIHFLRPRRFGKSLFTSMLGYYYDLASKDEFDLLFNDTYIHANPTKERNSYYILNFNFSGFSNKRGEELEKEFDDKVREAIENCIEKYDFPVKVRENISAARMLSNFISQMQHKERIGDFYVIIDEYDHFANDLLSFPQRGAEVQFQEFTNVMGSEGYVRAFYEELKNGTQKGIGRIFLTGVSPISLDSMTSGFNISTNLSLEPRYHEMMGFTSEEVKGLISIVDGINNKEKTLLELKQYYDGYRFSRRAKHHTFNPNMVLYYLNHFQNNGYEPEDIIDRNIFSDYTKLEQILYINKNIAQKNNEETSHLRDLQRILDGEHPSVLITTQFTLTKSFNEQDFYSLLFYLGYLTIDHADEFELTMKIPNMVMKKVFINYFQNMIEQELAYQADIKGWQSAIAAFITRNDAALYIQEIESILSRYSDRMFINFKERSIQQIGEMIVGAITGVDSDLEDENDKGYSDHVIIPMNTNYHRKLIEYKYLKKDYTAAQLKQVIMDAKAEIEKYMSSRQVQRYPYDAWIMVFAKDSCVYHEAICITEQ